MPEAPRWHHGWCRPAGGNAGWQGDVTGDLYASSDFGVVRLARGTNSWTLAASGMPNVEVAGLTIVSTERKLYAASHGLSAWALKLP